MSDFKREERYIVIKRKGLTKSQELEIRNTLLKNNITTVGCVVVESDWPIYEDVWMMIEKDYNNKKVKYHKPTSCNSCGGEIV